MEFYIKITFKFWAEIRSIGWNMLTIISYCCRFKTFTRGEFKTPVRPSIHVYITKRKKTLLTIILLSCRYNLDLINLFEYRYR